MKRKTRQLALAVVSLFISFASCNKEDSNPFSSSDVSTNLQSGKWKVVLYKDGTNDETSDYNGYQFTFQSTGAVEAAKAGITANGTWSTDTDDSQVKLNLNFGLLDFPLNELNDDWHVTEQSATSIKLEDISGGSGDEHYLNFSKI